MQGVGPPSYIAFASADPHAHPRRGEAAQSAGKSNRVDDSIHFARLQSRQAGNGNRTGESDDSRRPTYIVSWIALGLGVMRGCLREL